VSNDYVVTAGGETRIVTRRMREFPTDSWTIDRVLDDGGYESAKRAITTMLPDELIELVKASGLRGRGGAGFPTGVKWSFVPKDVFPKYVVVNHDEGEPGTFKDRELAELDPHQLIEGIIIAAWANQAEKAFIYCRGEFALGARRMDRALNEAYDRGYLGKGILGSTSTSCCTGAPAPTSAARSPRCWTRSRGTAGSRVSDPRSPRSRASTDSRR
jgi:NADH-quinone oxidoreductase subunit F